jgi:hypothetical protein
VNKSKRVTGGVKQDFLFFILHVDSAYRLRSSAFLAYIFNFFRSINVCMHRRMTLSTPKGV